MENSLSFFLNVFTLAIILFSAHLLLLRSFERQTYQPLAVCLLSISLVICQPTVGILLPDWQHVFLIFSLPALLLIAPSFWFYVCGITAEVPWHVKKVSIRHFILPILGLLVSFVALVLPADIQHALLVEGNDGILKELSVFLRIITVGALITTLVLVLAWVIQSGFYFYKIVKRLGQYRQHLKALFASTESKEIKWLSWLLLAVGFVWLAAAINIILDNLFFATQVNANIAGAVILIMIWTVALWGLRQKPGFEELYDNKEDIQAVLATASASSGKYQRSALSTEQSQQIAEKIDAAMSNDSLYLDASLSLQKLAKHISTSPNYISQTLNESIGLSFFDYVNKFRVNQAKQLLLQTDDTVLDIAMQVGFNAKSSFYSAFKKEAQVTPSRYRKAQQSE